MIMASISYGQNADMSLLTYNIRLDVSSDKENAWTHRKGHLANQLKFYEPSIFGVQEALPHQVAYLKKELVNYKHIGIGRDGGDRGEYAALFYRSDRFDVVKSATFWLSLTPDVPSKSWDAAYPRICTYALFKDKKTGLKFWVFNTHLDHKGEKSRMHGIDLILSKIAQENTDAFPVIFMGDLNAVADSQEILKLNTSMLDGMKASVNAPFGPSGTFTGFRFDLPVTKRIDYIYVSKGNQIQVLKYAVLSDLKDLKYPSDHLPVYIKISLHSIN